MDYLPNQNPSATQVINPQEKQPQPSSKRILFFVAIILIIFFSISAISFFLIKNLSQKQKVSEETPANTYESSITPTSQPQGESSSPVGLGQSSGGIALRGSTIGLIGLSTSTRNLSGMLVQINQIDLCVSPDLYVYATVTDKDGSVFSAVRSSDFTITLDSKPVDTFDFSIVSDQNIPLNTTLVLDHSGSMKGDPIVKTKEAAVSFIDNLKQEDQIALVQFDTQIDLLQNLTKDKEQIKNLINNIQPRSDTALYDVTHFAAENNSGCGRKAVVLLTDGRDTASKKYTVDQAIEKANLNNVPVFVVGLKSYQFTPEILKKIAEGTGAQYFEAPSPQDLLTLYQKISDQLKGQYLFKFKLDIEKTGKEHRMKISSNVTGSQTTSEKGFIY